MSDQEEAELPPGLDLLWGRRTRGQRGPKPGLDLESIVDAAIAVADAEGLAAVSMARVARELGFTTMSLYRYVASKDELLTLMWNASAAGAPTITGEGWRERLESWALAQHDLLQRRTWVLEMPLASPPAGPNSLAWIEQAVGALDGTGLLDSDKLAVVGLLSSYTLSEARMAHEEHSALARGGKPVDYAAVLRAVVDRQTYPTLYRMAHSGDIDDPEGDGQEASFRFGLERILDGVAALVATRNGRTAAR